MSEDASNNLFESSDEESETKVAPDVKPDVADNVKVEVVEEPIVLKKEEPVDVTQASNAALFESDEEEGSGDEVARRSGASSTSAAMSDAVPSGQASSTSTKEEDDADRDLFVVVAQGEPVTAEIPPPKMYPSNDIVSTFSLPNAVAIEPNEFNPKNFDESKSSFSKSRINITRTTGSVIRWRKVKDENGNEKVESNTRIIRWPDGTVQLQLGDEVFTVSSRQVQPTEYELVYRDGAETVNTCMGVITSRLKFMPSDLAKSATHRSLRQDVAKRSAREQIVRSKQFVDFTQRQAELAKLKESVRMPAKGGAAGGIGGKKSSKRFLEISDYDRERYGGEDSDSDDEGRSGFSFGRDDEEAAGSRLMRAKEGKGIRRAGSSGAAGKKRKGKSSDDEEEEEEEEEEASEDSFLASDEDEEEASSGDDDDKGSSSSSKSDGKRRRVLNEDDGDDD